jgi:hypothetical protein
MTQIAAGAAFCPASPTIEQSNRACHKQAGPHVYLERGQPASASKPNFTVCRKPNEVIIKQGRGCHRRQ